MLRRKGMNLGILRPRRILDRVGLALLAGLAAFTPSQADAQDVNTAGAPAQAGSTKGPAQPDAQMSNATAQSGATAQMTDKWPSTDAMSTVSSTMALPRAPTLADHKAQLNAFQVRVDALKSRLRGVEARVAGLKQAVLTGAVMATRASLVHRNEMGGGFRLEQATYRLDGEVIFSRSESDGLTDAKEIVLFDGPLTAGGHAVEVEMVFRGSAVGVFTYLQGYKFKVRSRYQLDVVEGRNTVLKIVAFEADDITVEARERFKVRYDVEVNDESPRRVTE